MAPWRLRDIGEGDLLPMPFSLLMVETAGFVQRAQDDTPHFSRVDVLCSVLNPRTGGSAGSLVLRYFDLDVWSMIGSDSGFDEAHVAQVAETLGQRAAEQTEDPILSEALHEASLVVGAIARLDAKPLVPVGETYILDEADAASLAQTIVQAREFGVVGG